jgi:hypothetical protein
MILVVDLLALAAVVVAIKRVAATDTSRWAHGGWSKAWWIVLALWMAWSTRFGVLPIGALAAIWRTHGLHRQPQRWNQDGLDVSFAEGIPVPFERRSPESAGAEDAEEES